MAWIAWIWMHLGGVSFWVGKNVEGSRKTGGWILLLSVRRHRGAKYLDTRTRTRTETERHNRLAGCVVCP